MTRRVTTVVVARAARAAAARMTAPTTPKGMRDTRAGWAGGLSCPLSLRSDDPLEARAATHIRTILMARIEPVCSALQRAALRSASDAVSGSN
jgi:hypothetical protein